MSHPRYTTQKPLSVHITPTYLPYTSLLSTSPFIRNPSTHPKKKKHKSAHHLQTPHPNPLLHPHHT
ncbi:hypothetical protein BofuT4_uP092660.1 [Botrytis cinerea T4]|uniref:Uncharacterized protein n=1 Tax=Botryotinia fuckeliana (strain T4) TaxID=999810 RepID=G2YDZ6_BOTF4|nr:hypothetical protein BofuT4_uP092660.1 [Botrytis cinerea T4]